MVDGTEHNLRNIATSVKEFYRNAIAPYGMGMTFMPVDNNELINTSNIISIREMSEDEVSKLNEPEEPEEVVGLRETEVEVEEAEESEETEQPSSE